MESSELEDKLKKSRISKKDMFDAARGGDSGDMSDKGWQPVTDHIVNPDTRIWE